MNSVEDDSGPQLALVHALGCAAGERTQLNVDADVSETAARAPLKNIV